MGKKLLEHRFPADPDLEEVARRIWQAGVAWEIAVGAAVLLRKEGQLGRRPPHVGAAR